MTNIPLTGHPRFQSLSVLPDTGIAAYSPNQLIIQSRTGGLTTLTQIGEDIHEVTLDGCRFAFVFGSKEDRVRNVSKATLIPMCVFQAARGTIKDLPFPTVVDSNPDHLLLSSMFDFYDAAAEVHVLPDGTVLVNNQSVIDGVFPQFFLSPISRELRIS